MRKFVSAIESAFRLLAAVSVSSRTRRLSTAVATLLMLMAAFQIRVSSVDQEFPGFSPGSSLPATAILTLRGNRPISVNAALTMGGATILSGATIDTPGEFGAAINLGSLGMVDIAPNTTLTTTFNQKDTLKVFLVKGCIRLQASKGTAGEINSPEGVAEKTDTLTGGNLSHCFGQDAHLSAQAASDRVGRDGLFSLGKAAAWAVIGGRARAGEGVVLVGRGSNPAPLAP